MYQPSSGGRTYVPLERQARIIGGSSTPRFARMLSWKYSRMPASAVSEDLTENHHRSTSRELVQRVSQAVSAIAHEQEFAWSYAVPALPEAVARIAVGRDGAMAPIREEGYREVMNGTIALYSRKGDRMHTIYLGCAPQYGKENFDAVLDMELERISDSYPDVEIIGLGDGARDNWEYFADRTDVAIVDFYHATEYISPIAASMSQPGQTAEAWLEWACHQLKHAPNAARQLLAAMRRAGAGAKGRQREALEKSIRYFHNNQHRMRYWEYRAKNYPIGSGVTEAGCKVMTKQRLCCSGMRWTTTSTEDMLLLRGLTLTDGRWKQFWQKIGRYGVPVITE